MAFVDHCHTAEDVRANAKKVLEKRRAQFQVTKAIFRGEITAPKPKAPPKQKSPPTEIAALTAPVVARFQGEILIEPRQPAVITIDQIQAEVCKFAKITLRNLNGDCRRNEFMTPRHIAYMLSHHFTTRSLPSIGRKFGGRNHTTIMHGCTKLAPVLRDLKGRLSDRAPLSEWVAAAFEAHERIKPKGLGRKLRSSDLRRVNESCSA